MKRILCWTTILVLSFRVVQVQAAVEASGGAGPSVMTDHEGNANGFNIAITVLHDPSAGPWLKHLINTGGGIESGLLVPITEEFTNIGTSTWTDWHEEIVGPIDSGTGFGPATAFAFERGSVRVYRNGNLLAQGVDYQLQFTLHPVVQPGPNPGNHVDAGQHWQSVSIFFSGANSIQPTDTLTIEKNIFETYLNGKIWTPLIEPVIAQYPTIPEPASVVPFAAAFVLLGYCGRRRAAGNRAGSSATLTW